MADRWIKPEEVVDGVFGSPLVNLARALAFVGGIFILATARYVWSGWRLDDASYKVTLTNFSVGYGEVHPIDTAWLRTRSRRSRSFPQARWGARPLARPNGFGAFFIVQIDRRGGPSFLHPGEDVWIAAGDTVVRVVRSTKVAAGSIFAEPKKPIKVGRGYRPA